MQQHDPETLNSVIGSGASFIAEIIPELKEKLPGLENPPALEPEQARFRLFDSASAFLKRAAENQPLMLVLDDLHWADRSSLLLLEFLAREIEFSSLLIVGTYRQVDVSRRHPLSETLGSLMRSRGFQRMQLSGLNEKDVAQLIQETAGETLSFNEVEAIRQRTEGNPLFIGELVRTLNQESSQVGEVVSVF